MKKYNIRNYIQYKKDVKNAINIINEELRGELDVIRQDFDAERQKIQNYYTKEIM